MYISYLKILLSFLQLRRELEAIADYRGFEKAEQTWKDYEPKIEKQSLLEGRSQPKLQSLRAEYESKIEDAGDDGKCKLLSIMCHISAHFLVSVHPINCRVEIILRKC